LRHIAIGITIFLKSRPERARGILPLALPFPWPLPSALVLVSGNDLKIAGSGANPPADFEIVFNP
jgi:hypothetical protein